MKKPASKNQKAYNSSSEDGLSDGSDYDQSDTDSLEEDIAKYYENEQKDEISTEEEVLGVHSGDDSDDDDEFYGEGKITKSDMGISDDDEEDEITTKAWGKHKNTYYNGDVLDNTKRGKHDKYTEEEKIENEKLLLKSSRETQDKLLKIIDDADGNLDDFLLGDLIAEKKQKRIEAEKEEKGIIEVDLSQMSEKEKLSLLKKESPEFLTYLEDYKRLMTLVRDELTPILTKIKKLNLMSMEAGVFINSFNKLVLNYCTNINFYVLLKARKIDTKNHPCSKWLEQYKETVDRNERIFNRLFKHKIDEALNLIVNGETKLKSNKQSKPNDTKKSSLKIQGGEDIDDEEMGDFNFEGGDDDLMDDFNDDENMEGDEGPEPEGDYDNEKRSVSKDIIKNRGLTPKRKKELKNPRVKHKMKYRKANIRRKGQIPTPRKETKKYDGELTGINRNAVKSRKFYGNDKKK